METLGYALLAVLLAIWGLVCWAMALFGLPGSWCLLAAATAYAWAGPVAGIMAISWPVIAVLLVLAIAGEIVETLAGAWGAQRAGASRRAMLLALLGSLLGSVCGAVLGAPLPVVGWLVGAIFFAAVGALLGAVLGEGWKGRRSEDTWRVGVAAFWGRMWGTVGKLGAVSAMLVILLLSLLF